MRCTKFIYAIIVFHFSLLQGGVYLEKPKNFHPKASVVGTCYLHYQDKILLMHRQDFVPEGNRWGIPGGKLNKEEPVLNGVLREVFEETGFLLDPKKMHQMGKLYIKVPNFDFEYIMYDYEDEIENPQDVKIKFEEHKGFTWVTPEDALKMNLMTDEDTCIRITFGIDSDKIMK